MTFVRHDYSEMFSVAPDPDTQGGRDDTDKMGFFLVSVYDDRRHVNRFIRTRGVCLEADQQQVADQPAAHGSDVCSGPQLKHIIDNPLGVYMRHAWAGKHELPYGNLDEFSRKKVYNDYPILAL